VPKNRNRDNAGQDHGTHRLGQRAATSKRTQPMAISVQLRAVGGTSNSRLSGLTVVIGAG
jgi:hypothetical protein